MPELMTAIYHSKPICIFDLLDQHGQYIEEIRSEYRRASQSHQLICPECHGALELCAGAIVAPYFRHKSVCDCPITQELKTEAGKRMYQGKKMLYSLGKTAKSGEVTIQEANKNLRYHPVVINLENKTEAFLYLDGTSRNFEELRRAQEGFKENHIIPYWFLNKKYQSNSRNLTSNEAEVLPLNQGILYYLDLENQQIDFRKSYQTPYGERCYYTETLSLDDLKLDSEGEFNQAFLKNYEEYVKTERKKLDRVLRIPIEDGLDEEYFECSFVYMDAINEIWVLPILQLKLADHSFNDQAIKNREEYVEECNNRFFEIPDYKREESVLELLDYIDHRRYASNWLT